MVTAAASSSSRPSPPPPPSPLLFTSIPEHEKEEDDEPGEEPPISATAAASEPYKHNPTPLHTKATAPKKKTQPKPTNADDSDDPSILCNKCRPSSRDKTTTVVFPIDSSPNSTNPHRLLRSLFLTLSRLTPRSSSSSTATTTPQPPDEAEQWRAAAAELSRKLLHATRRRDEALTESTRLKHSLSELSLKLDCLETYCHDLRSALDRSAASGPPPPAGSLPVEPFLRSVSDARSAVRLLARALCPHLRQTRSVDRLAALVQPLDPRSAAAQCRNPKNLLVLLEALLNRVFYEDFETGFGLNLDEPLDPSVRCQTARTGFELVREVGWDDVLSRGTKHYSEGLSRFCDRRMGEVVGALGWARTWPEGLLQAFFGAAKGVWLVYLLARSVQPPAPVLRVRPGAKFHLGFMEDAAGNRAGQLEPDQVKMMVAPGFYVYSTSCGVVKCKVLCTYKNGHNGSDSSS